MQILLSLAGMALILLIAFLLSSNRRAIRPRVVLSAFALQAGLAALVLYVPWGNRVLQGAATGVSNLLGYANEGTKFLFGGLATDPLGQNFAIQALPVIIFFAAFISILYHLGIMQYVIRWIGGGLQKVTGISKVESLCAASNIFVGQSESPLVIRPYLATLNPAQLFCVMTVGMAGVAGTILAAYASMGIRIDYLIAAAFMSAPGGILMAKLIMPDDPNEPAVDDPDIALEMHEDEKPANLIMAASQGAQTGVRLAVAVGAMVLAFVALVALANGVLGGLGNLVGLKGLSFQGLLGQVFAPVMYLLGVPWNEAATAGGLFGTKIVLNEFVAFIDLGALKTLSAPTVAIVTFALCGFANFSSIAIQMAVTGGLAPNQRPMIAKLGLKALAAGSLSNLMSAALAGLFLSLA
ncbi:MAG: NupC/NupG family nucleoside CNT transporter [Sphingomonadales bacterium]|jgi:CNT family concentrative nucleoside transporter|nr:NupC/NupG family nucleoside CNT transporter [Sphingomonadales bacterium]MBK9005078.1 NupC/NupG family nucleoside CNT transporter [Sphingomonadales bacterium]MBK9267189.1 NupC/NupG family nucleoside CNT transporter [Sphingomonadales bacterium]MBP6433469.1 NupC/NupG family nucleoside CNT transporter [Sphingorhabdus sp.]